MLLWAGWVGSQVAAQTTAAAATPAKPVPAGRAAKNVAVITIHGPIDKWTAVGVQRRLDKAVADGADAIVFDINTLGGSLSATLRICSAIKACRVSNTVAWVNPDAYSAGAIIAVACREIVISPAASFGDALPVAMSPLLQSLEAMPDDEREKILGPLIAEVVDSARRNGYDEMLVQGLVRRGVELWLVEHTATGERMFVTADQYERAVGKPPSRTTPQIVSATGAVGGGQPMPLPDKPDLAGTKPVSEGPTAYQPASPATSQTLASEVNTYLELNGAVSKRPDLAKPEHAGKYREVEYVADGHGLVFLKSDQMLRYKMAVDTVRSEEELKAFFGATTVARQNPTWSEGLVRFLRNPIVMAILVVVFLLAMFIEMTHPGVILPGAVATVCLLALVIPPVLIDLSAWWAVAAVVLGIACVGVELLLIPGFGVFGVIGIVLLFGGLLGIFVGGPSGLFPNTAKGRDDLAFAGASILISAVTAGILMYFVGKHLPGLPVVNRLVLKAKHGDADSSDGGDGLLSAMGPAIEGRPAIGAVGRTVTPLRPSGRVQIGDTIHDVVADMGFIDINQQVRVVAVDEFRTVVERAST